MSSGQQWGTIVGGIVGAWVGSYSGNTMQGAQIGMAIGGYAGSVIDPTIIKGPSIGDASAQTSLGGAPIPKVYGHSPPIAPTLIDGDKIARKITRQEDVGKGTTAKTENEAWVATRAFLVCEGEVAGYARITRNGKLVYSTIASDQIDVDSASFANQITIYLGSETQGPDPSLEAIHGVGNTPYYRGRSYFVVRDDDETQTGGAANQYRVEVVASGESTTECTDADRPWHHGDTGLSQTIFDADMNDQVFLVAGWNNNLRRSIDGVTWDAVDYLADTGWAPGDAITNIWYSESEGLWFMSKFDKIARSSNQGGLWGIWGTPRHHIVDRTVTSINGSFWAGAANVDSSIIFRPGQLEHAEDVDYGPHGIVTALGSIDSVTYIGTADGNILVSPDEVLYTAPQGIRRIVGGNGIIMVVLESGGYLTQRPGDIEFQYHGVGTVADAVYTRGLFYRTSGYSIETSPDAEPDNWTTVDTYFSDNDAGAYLAYFGDMVFGVIQGGGKTAVTEYVWWLPDIAGAFVDINGNVYGICNERIAGDAAIWKDVVSDIAWRASPLLPDRLNIDHMNDEVPGFVLGNAGLTGTGYVRTLCTFYFTDGPEYDGQINFIRRGGPIVATFTDNDMLVVEDDDDDTRDMAVDGIQRLTVMYPDPTNQYVPTPQTSPRTSPDITASNNLTVECPIPFDADTMAQKTDILQKIAFLPLEGGFKRAMPAEFSKYVSSDPIMFNDRRYLIGRTSNDDSMVRFEATYDRVSAYTSRALGSTGPAPSPQTSNTKGPTIFEAMNLPRTRTAENVPGISLAARGLLPGWPGADLYLSVDGGISEQLVLRMTNEAVIGWLAEDVGPAEEPITVALFPRGELHSITSDQIAARQNAFAITTNEVSEVGQFQTATETSGGEYELTDTIRGELGTTAVAHETNNQFVLLDGAVYFLPLDASLIGKTLIFRPVTLGTVPANNNTYSIVFRPLFTGPEVIDFLETDAGVVITADDGSPIQVTHA